MIKSAQYWIDKLNLIAHPEGGYYRETYRAELSIPKEALPSHFTGPRLVSTAMEKTSPPSIDCGRTSCGISIPAARSLSM